ncbi:MAG TPA: flagellar brake protein [Desulfobacterales bacterium]|nr:flagellar brake protein [Desulfobacterales bacterium]
MSQETEAKNLNEGMRLNIELGSQLLIQVEGIEKSFKSNLVGLMPQEFLIIEMPSSYKISGLQRGKHLFVNYLSLGNAYEFDSSILGIISEPFPLLFLSYPEKVQKLDLRKNSRVNCYIPAIANLKKTELKGVISDISRTGCRFIIKVPPILQLQQILVVDEIKISFPLTGMNDVFEFPGIVRNTTQDKERIAWGIEFEKLDSEVSSKIDDYINKLAESSINQIRI